MLFEKGQKVSFEMKPVIQLDSSGCGIACVASIAGRPYPLVKSTAHLMGISVEDQKLWSETSYVRSLLRRYGFKTGAREVPFRTWKGLPDLALLSTKWHLEKGQPFWHWVVFVRENERSYVLDSKRRLRTHRRTDFGRMKPRWYIPVRRV